MLQSGKEPRVGLVFEIKEGARAAIVTDRVYGPRPLTESKIEERHQELQRNMSSDPQDYRLEKMGFS
jgi:hypothetical protein